MNDEAPQPLNPAPTTRRGALSWWPFVTAMLTPPLLLILVARVDDALAGVVGGAGGASALFCGFWLARRLFAEDSWKMQLFMIVVFSALLLLVSLVLCCIGFTLGGGELIPDLRCQRLDGT